LYGNNWVSRRAARSLRLIQRINEETAMYKFIGLIAALGMLGATSLTPVAAAPTAKAGIKNSALSVDDFSAAKKKKKKKSAKKKVDATKSYMSTEPAAGDKKATKKKKSKKKKKTSKKATDLILYRIAA
jgi:hypothetical protein